MADRLAQLRELGELLSAGVLTQAEFEQQKASILNGLTGRSRNHRQEHARRQNRAAHIRPAR